MPRPVDLTIRRFEEDDIDGISELWQKFASMREDMTQHRILNENAADYFYGYATGLLNRKDTLTLVAQSGDELAGYLIASKQRKPPIYRHTRVAYLSDVFIDEGHRRKGILRQFIQKLEEWCQREGITAIDVMLFSSNVLAHDIYKAMGFEDYRIVMRRVVTEPED